MKFLKFLFKAKSLNAVVGKSIDMLGGAWGDVCRTSIIVTFPKLSMISFNT